MHWDQFLRTAERLALGGTAGDHRSAVSRAYYASYHFFLEMFRQQRLPQPREVAHAKMLQALRAVTAPSMKSVADGFDDFLEWRRKADYDFSLSVGSVEANKSVIAARGIVAGFQALLASPDGPQAVFDLRAYFHRLLGLPPPTP